MATYFPGRGGADNRRVEKAAMKGKEGDRGGEKKARSKREVKGVDEQREVKRKGDHKLALAK